MSLLLIQLFAGNRKSVEYLPHPVFGDVHTDHRICTARAEKEVLFRDMLRIFVDDARDDLPPAKLGDEFSSTSSGVTEHIHIGATLEAVARVGRKPKLLGAAADGR